MTTTRVTNGFDSYVSEKAPASNFYSQPTLRVSAGAGKAQYAYLYFTRPFPLGVTITSAKLRLRQHMAHTGNKTLTLYRINAAFAQTRLNWNNDPGITGSAVQVAKGTTPHAELWEFDVTAHMQLVANGTAWYGFRITSNHLTQLLFHSMQSHNVAFRPHLEITWSDAPDKPDQLQPAGGRVISKTHPTFSFKYNDPSGEDGIQSVQVQVATTEALLLANTPDVWDSGAYSTTAASLDSSVAGWTAGATAGTLYHWRVRVTDDSGQTSVWSDPETFVRQPKATMTATVDGGTNMLSPVPTVAWTFTGQTQKHYQVMVFDADNPSVKVWDSGKVTSTLTSLALPLGVVKNDAAHFTFVIRVYDNLARQTGPGDPVWVEKRIDSVVAYDAATAGPDTLSGVSDPAFPTYQLTWTDDIDPDYFLVQRRLLGSTTWTYVKDLIDPDDVRSGSFFIYDDHGAGMYKEYEWRVLSMRGGKQSATNLLVNGKVRRLAPFLMTPDKSKIIALANPDRERTNSDRQDLIEPLGAPPVLFTQYIGGDRGEVSGLIADNFLPGYTGKQMFEWFKWMRLNPGIRLKLFIADESLDVAIFNCEYDTLTDAEGLYYSVSFSWVAL